MSLCACEWDKMCESFKQTCDIHYQINRDKQKKNGDPILFSWANNLDKSIARPLLLCEI